MGSTGCHLEDQHKCCWSAWIRSWLTQSNPIRSISYKEVTTGQKYVTRTMRVSYVFQVLSKHRATNSMPPRKGKSPAGPPAKRQKTTANLKSRQAKSPKEEEREKSETAPILVVENVYLACRHCAISALGVLFRETGARGP